MRLGWLMCSMAFRERACLLASCFLELAPRQVAVCPRCFYQSYVANSLSSSPRRFCCFSVETRTSLSSFLGIGSAERLVAVQVFSYYTKFGNQGLGAIVLSSICE